MDWGKIYDRGVPGAGLALASIATWYTVHPPSTASGVPFPLTPQWPTMLLALSAALLLVSLGRLALAARRPAGQTISNWNPSAIVFNRLYAHPEHLDRDHFLEFVITAFNASSKRIELRGIDGKIGFATIGGSAIKAVVVFPCPQLVFDRSFKRRHDNLSTFQLKVIQWLPRNVTEEFLSRLKKGPLLLNIGELRLVAAPTDGPLQSAQLKIADTATLAGDMPAEARLGVIATAVTGNAAALPPQRAYPSGAGSDLGR
jgi:hypothetical protein